MADKLVSGGTALSMAMCLASVVLWVRSHRGGEAIECVSPRWRVVVVSSRGELGLNLWEGWFVPKDSPAGRWKHWAPAPYQATLSGDPWWDEFGFDAGDIQVMPLVGAVRMHDWLDPRWMGRQRWVTLPYWWVVLMSWIMPVMWWTRRRHRLTQS